MRLFYIIGIPSTVLRRLEGKLRGASRVAATRMDLGKQGFPVLVPYPGEAARVLRDSFDGVDDPADLKVVALPYAQLPDDLLQELDAVEGLGSTVVRAVAGTDGWPVFKKKKDKLDQAFLDSLFFTLLEAAGAGASSDTLPSEVFALVSERTPRLIIAGGALASVDEIAEHRRDFAARAAHALEDVTRNRGNVGSFDDFFRTKGLRFASTGGITAKVTYPLAGKDHSQSTNNHLKQGDGTTRIAAVRIYFDVIQDGKQCFVVVLYAGPHPSSDVARRISLPELQDEE